MRISFIIISIFFTKIDNVVCGMSCILWITGVCSCHLLAVVGRSELLADSWASRDHSVPIECHAFILDSQFDIERLFPEFNSLIPVTVNPV